MAHQGAALDLAACRTLVALDVPFIAPSPATAGEAPRLVEQLVEELLTDTHLAADLVGRVSVSRHHPYIGP